MSGKYKAGVLGAAVLGGLGGLVWQRQRATQLENAIAALSQAGNGTNSGIATPVDIRRPIKTETDDELRLEIEKTRQEIAGLEAIWQKMNPPETHAQTLFTDNRDPSKGPVRVEHFRNLGQETPAAAFQTVVWASAKKEDSALSSLVDLSPTGREKLNAIASKVESTPEKLIGMLLALGIFNDDGYEIGVASEPNESRQVTLTIRRVPAGSTNLQGGKKISLRLGEPGWRLPISDAMIDAIPSFLEQASMHVAPKRASD
ncbi:MAG: hypothetical protein ABIO94_06180 [Opitutaceae bacterium]